MAGDKKSPYQLKLDELLESAREEFCKAEKFHFGYKVALTNYKRVTVDSQEYADEIAEYGYLVALKILGVKLRYTQALFVGAVNLRVFRKIYLLMSVRQGKTFGMACSALIEAYLSQEINVFASAKPKTDILMSQAWDIALGDNVDKDFYKSLFDAKDKRERQAISLAHDNIGFSTQGSIIAKTTSGNQAAGKGGSSYIDESGEISDDNYKKLGRYDLGHDKNGNPLYVVESSNAYALNHFYRAVTNEDVGKDELILWGDIRASFIEGAYRGTSLSIDEYEKMRESEPNKLFDILVSDIQKSSFYDFDDMIMVNYLSDFGYTSDNRFFNITPEIDDSPASTESEFFAGVDLASKGVDRIPVTILEKVSPKRLKVVKVVDVKPEKWSDFETPDVIKNSVITLLNHYNVKAVAIDRTGVGEFLFDAIAGSRELKAKAIGVNFGERPTKSRADNERPRRTPYLLSDENAKNAYNKRVEMHLDLKEAIESKIISFSSKTYDMARVEMNAVESGEESTGGRFTLVNKTKIKAKIGKSPDILDSIVLALHAYVRINKMDKSASVNAYLSMMR